MEISFVMLGNRIIGSSLERIPDGELEALELRVFRLGIEIDRVDEPQRELEDREEDPELRAGRVPQLGDVPLLVVRVRITRVAEEDEPQRIVQPVDVFGVDN